MDPQSAAGQSEEGVDTPSEPSAIPESTAAHKNSTLYRAALDLLVFLALTLTFLPIFYRASGGDLWSDEADYALAGARGFQANRFDISDRRAEPERLIKARHFHAPLTADIVYAAAHFGTEDQTIRFPFVLAGALSIGLVYLCGASIFAGRREIGAACAVLAGIVPPVVRMASHALPWAFIILELLFILWSLVKLAETKQARWLTVLGCGIGFLFVTSEFFFVAVPAIAAALPFLLWKPWRERAARSRLLKAAGAGFVLIALVVGVFWPAGVQGHAVTMLRHYVQMRHSEAFPVNVGSQIFAVAPKWAYLYWYWNDYRPFFVCFALGIPAMIVLLALRKLPLSTIPLVSLTTLLLVAAHRSHIIGPEYLAHCLPFLALIGAFFVYAISLVYRPLGFVAIALLSIPVARWSPRVRLPGMDARAQISRWPAASRFLAARWKQGDRIVIGSQPVTVGHWYLVYHAHIPPLDYQFQALPVHDPKGPFIERLSHGFYKYAAVSNMVEDYVDLDARTRKILATWTVIWRSDEKGSGASRLTIYQAPKPLLLDSHTAPVPPKQTH